MPALRQPVKRRSFWIKTIAAVALAAAAIFDWSRPPHEQLSVRIYEAIVIAPYQYAARPLISRFVRCRYTLTCSQYSVEAMRTHGMPRGTWLTTKRLLRCRPGVPLGTNDPVPFRER